MKFDKKDLGDATRLEGALVYIQGSLQISS